MKKRLLALGLILTMLLSGCALPEPPETAADGTPWSDDWINLGAVLGVEPLEGWSLQRNEDALAAEGMYFASWTWGQPEKDDAGTLRHPAQLFLVLSECESPADAEALVQEWTGMARETYVTGEADTLETALGSFTALPYRAADPEASFDLGISCLGIIGSRAVNLEISCRDGVDLDLEQTLTAFLSGFHFAS